MSSAHLQRNRLHQAVSKYHIALQTTDESSIRMLVVVILKCGKMGSTCFIHRVVSLFLKVFEIYLRWEDDTMSTFDKQFRSKNIYRNILHRKHTFVFGHKVDLLCE